MSATNYTPIYLYNSGTATNTPLAANLGAGELAINYADGKLFYKDGSATVQVIGWKTVPATAGGTGLTSFAVGDLIYADTTTTLAKLADVATGNALISGGVSTAPSWGKIGLTTHVSGTLPVGNGGTGLTTLTAGYIPYGNGTSAFNSSANLTFDGSNLSVTGYTNSASFRPTSSTVPTNGLFLPTTNTIAFATNSAEVARFDSTGTLFVGATSSPQTSKVFFTQTAVGGYTLGINAVSNSGTYYLVNLFAANTQTGTISSNGTTTVYGVTSDRRLKENIVPFTNGLAVISSLKPSEFNYKSNKNNIYQGFIADELQNVVPNAVIGNPDAVDEIGNPMYQSIDSSFLVPHLVAAIQEQQTQIDKLQAQITILQAKGT